MKLSGIVDYLESHGYVDARKDKTAVGRSIARFMRQLLEDPNLQEVLKAIEEYRLLVPVTELINDQIKRGEIRAETFSTEFWNETHKRRKELQDKIVSQLRGNLGARVYLLRVLGVLLKDYGVDGDFELPDVGVAFPPVNSEA